MRNAKKATKKRVAKKATKKKPATRPGVKLWTRADVALMRKLYRTTPNAVIAKKLKRTLGSVAAKAGLLGLKKKVAKKKAAPKKKVVTRKAAPKRKVAKKKVVRKKKK